MQTQLWDVLVKVTPEKYVYDRQAVSEEYEMPLYHCNHHNSVRGDVEDSQLDAKDIRWEDPVDEQGRIACGSGRWRDMFRLVT